MFDRASEISQHIHYLRRYARALSGTQERGDRYVRFCLETLVATPGVLKGRPGLRLSLYKHFHQTCAGIVARLERRDAESSSPAPLDFLDFDVQDLPPQERQVLLLTALEGFSPEEAAEILEIEAGTVERKLAAARAKLNEQTLSSVLIIEDEPIIAFDIARIVTEIGHRVAGTAATQPEAVAMAIEKEPGIVLADIKLGDGGSGIDAVGEILQSMDVPVVFVTAYPERLLSGEGREPAFLVTKPFEPDELKVTIFQALLAGRSQAQQRALG